MTEKQPVTRWPPGQRKTFAEKNAKTLASEVDWDERIARLHEIFEELYPGKEKR